MGVHRTGTQTCAAGASACLEAGMNEFSRVPGCMDLRHIAKALFFAGVAACCASCSQAAQSAFHSSFRTSFHQSFMSSCTQNHPGVAAYKSYCSCAETYIETRETDAQLMALNTQSPVVQQAIASCRPLLNNS